MESLRAALLYLPPVFALAVGILLGVISEKLLIPRLLIRARRTRWRADEVILTGLRGSFFLWSVSLGVYVALWLTPVEVGLRRLVGRVLFVVLTFSLTVVIARIAEASLRTYTLRDRGTSPASSILTNVIRLVVFLLGTLVILQALGVAITPLLTALGVGGLAVALALQDTLANLFAGLHVIASRQVRIGDYIRLDSGEVGRIADINWRNTTIRERPDNLIIVPNAKLASAIITNLDRPDKAVLVPLDVGVSYESDFDRVEQVTLEVAREVQRQSPAAVREFAPQLRFKSLGDFSVNFTVTLRAREFEARELVRHEFLKRLLGRYRAEGIEIPFPVRTVLVQDARRREPAGHR